ncbi:MAG: signal peptidase I [Clostridiales bacterium]|nr:signal peptidase I [Clostridiales bacterium]
MNDEIWMEPVDGPETRPHENLFSNLYEWVEAAVFSLICVVLVFTFLFRVVGVDGPSMTPTLLNKERLIMTSINYTPQRGDIVVINRFTQEPLVKRIIAVEGDILEIDGETGEVRVNGETLDESYIRGTTYPIEMESPFQVSEGHVFVMGDNRENSTDSRHHSVNEVPVKNIIGKAVWRIWPLNKFGSIY